MSEQELSALLEQVVRYGVTVWQEQILNTGNLIQLIVIGLIFALARRLKPHLTQWAHRVTAKLASVPVFERLGPALHSVVVPFSWLFFQWIAVGVFVYLNLPHPIMTLTTSLLSAWVFIRFATHWMSSDAWSHMIAISAWSIAALNIVGLLDPTLEVLDMVAITVGNLRLSLLTFVKGGVILAVLLWIATGLSSVAERSMRRMRDVSPVARVLMIKLLRVVLVIIAILIALNSLGIDLTALAVFSGALGVGLGFGLQKIFSNLVSGVILLMDKSIKPGDIIAIKDTFGWINHLGARYASVITRDGTEHLIPNEEMITQQVENWSHSHRRVRLRIPLEVDYASDPRQVIALCEEAAMMVPRVLIDPQPKCQLRGFGENGISMELRVWIDDPQEGRGNVITDVLLQVWDRFQQHQIKIPYPQRDVRLITDTLRSSEHSE